MHNAAVLSGRFFSMPAPGETQTNRDIRTLADAELPARVRGILEALLRIATNEFEPRLQGMLREFEQQLFRLADHARNPGVESGYLQTLRNMRLNQADLIPHFLVGMESALANLEQRTRPPAPKAASNDPTDFTRLSLVEEANMDTELVLRDIAQRSAANANLPLHFLGLRFGVLAAAPAFDAEQLPLGPYALSEVLQEASASLQLPPDSQLLLLRTFERKVMVDYVDIAERLNAELVAAGVLPVLTYVPLRKLGGTARPVPVEDAAAPPSEPPPRQTPATARAPTPAPAASSPAPETAAAPKPQRTGPHPFAAWMAPPPEDVHAGAQADPSFAMLQDMLSQQRDLRPAPRRGSARAAHPAGPVTLPAPGALNDALGHVRSVLAQSDSTVATSIEGIRGQVLQRLREAHGPNVGLSQTDNDTFDLLGMLYERIEREVRIDTLASTLLQRLQMPVLQTALKDQEFFSQTHHPARELLGTVADSGAKWFGEVDPDPALMQAIRRSVEHVVRHSHDDPSAFETSNRVLQAELQQQAKRSEMAERRHVEAARGKEKLQIAKEQAAETITELIGPSKPPKFVRALIEQAWADVLVLTLLRNDRDSDEWRAILATTQRVVAASCGDQPVPDPALVGDVESALSRVGYHADEAKAISQRLAGTHGEEDSASKTELAAALKARARLGGRDSKKKKDDIPPRSAEEEAQYDRLRVLPFGTWIEFTTNQQGDVIRKRLSWYSSITDNALFVNLRGQRIGEQSLDSLARMFARGQARVVTVERARVIDRAWQATLAALRGLAGRKGSKTKLQAAT